VEAGLEQRYRSPPAREQLRLWRRRLTRLQPALGPLVLRLAAHGLYHRARSRRTPVGRRRASPPTPLRSGSAWQASAVRGGWGSRRAPDAG